MATPEHPFVEDQSRPGFPTVESVRLAIRECFQSGDVDPDVVAEFPAEFTTPNGTTTGTIEELIAKCRIVQLTDEYPDKFRLSVSGVLQSALDKLA